VYIIYDITLFAYWDRMSATFIWNIYKCSF